MFGSAATVRAFGNVPMVLVMRPALTNGVAPMLIPSPSQSPAFTVWRNCSRSSFHPGGVSSSAVTVTPPISSSMPAPSETTPRVYSTMTAMVSPVVNGAALPSAHDGLISTERTLARVAVSRVKV